MDKLLYAAVDVDDKSFHVSVRSNLDPNNPICFQTKPNVKALSAKLIACQDKLKTNVKICYEATYIGYSLQRQLTDLGIKCDIIAPSLIPRTSKSSVKTDRLDAKNLSLLYLNNLLTPIHIPSTKEESVRALIRSRKFLTDQLKALKLHILSQLRLLGLHYKLDARSPNANYWTKVHLDWINSKINKIDDPFQKSNLSILIFELESLQQKLSLYEQEILKAANEPEYSEKVQNLICFRGIETLSAMTLISELGDIRRFKKPSQLTSYAGMDLKEYSSGGRERKYSMTKSGNRNIRTTIIEASQLVLKKPVISRRLKERRKNASLEAVQIADKCMARLHKKAMNLYAKGKIINKIKVACAREALGFIWESLMLCEDRNINATRSQKNKMN